MTKRKFCQNKYLLVPLLALLVGFCPFKLPTYVAEKSYRSLSHHEKSMLNHFFETVIKTDQLGHVLFFSTKPTSLFIVNTLDEEDHFTKAWNVWKSKEHFFQHPNFIVYEEVCDSKTYVYFINRKTLFAQCSCKAKLLKKLFSESFSIEELILKLKTNTFDELICKNQVLLGLLLGYGVESSLEYPNYIVSDPQIFGKKLTPILCAVDGKITTTQAEEDVTLCTFNSSMPIHPVSFIGNPESEEVKNLKALYSQELEKIEIVCNNKNLLRICLQKLCS